PLLPPGLGLARPTGAARMPAANSRTAAAPRTEPMLLRLARMVVHLFSYPIRCSFVVRMGLASLRMHLECRPFGGGRIGPNVRFAPLNDPDCLGPVGQRLRCGPSPRAPGWLNGAARR